MLIDSWTYIELDGRAIFNSNRENISYFILISPSLDFQLIRTVGLEPIYGLAHKTLLGTKALVAFRELYTLNSWSKKLLLIGRVYVSLFQPMSNQFLDVSNFIHPVYQYFK